jgi:hypothetical protein
MDLTYRTSPLPTLAGRAATLGRMRGASLGHRPASMLTHLCCQHWFGGISNYTRWK